MCTPSAAPTNDEGGLPGDVGRWKATSFLIVWLIVQALPLRFLARFPRAENVRQPKESPVVS